MQLIEEKKIERDFPASARYLIGVSGGRDSVALLHWLVDLGYEKLIVCHLNHQLRGQSSDADARFVEKLAGKYQVDFELGAANVRALAKKKKMSIETAAREARYSFFAKAAKRHRCHTIFLAHHADDLVETLLINLFRGAGSAGLVAIRESSTRRIDDVELTIVRPFLPVWRKEIDSYVREHRLRFREDATNKNLNPLRNRVRHRVIPYLEKMLGRNIRLTISRAATIAGEDEAWMDNQLPDSTDADSPAAAAPAEAALSVAKLRALPIALQRRAILKWLRAQKISELGFDVIERVRSLADRDARVAKVNLPKDRPVRRRAGRIFLE
ncbi:MAG: tRNA lysidine(34) synthetase TilS [Verrucomicrobia bacterium]|nr:MAG: tRNA lysidine(34) synthetase TilS [Verrucomicrobiota bacterium]